MEKNIGRMVKIASNQLSREFDKFAKPYDLTGTQNVRLFDFLSHELERRIIFNKIIEKEFNIQRSNNDMYILQRMDEKGVNLSPIFQKRC